MADFQEQVMGITGLTIDGSSTAPSRAEFSTFLNDGVIDVTNRSILLRPGDAENFLRESSEQTSNGFNPGSSKVFSVIRENGTDGQWYPCTNKPIKLQYKVTDVNSLEYASKYNPVYMITQNRNVHVFPAPSSDGNDGFKVLYINSSPEETDGTALDHASTGIKWFPEDRVYLVMLYASIKSLYSAMAAVKDDSGISDALAKARTLITDDAEHAALTDVTDEPSSGNYSALFYLGEEDEELISAALNIVQTEIARGNAVLTKDMKDYEWYYNRAKELQNQYNSAFGLMAPRGEQKK